MLHIYDVNGKVINDPGSHLHWRTISTAGLIRPSAGSSAERSLALEERGEPRTICVQPGGSQALFNSTNEPYWSNRVGLFVFLGL